MKIELPYPPTMNHLYANHFGQRRLSEKGRQYKAEVLAICYQSKVKPLIGDIVITLRAFRPRKIGDLDNLLKIIFDSLKGSAFNDDKQIIEIHAYRFDDKECPRVEIEIQEI